ncbi:M4 family metallopeptidase [Actinomadura sp. NAK00032]|uniref:M4 family metallopeptidase n=1 Tax=Actinomadura sp. NAK00032 TaxID=2742128 RepID=UPI001592AD0C|nr:M4 family metallopeptidase [Actinomadura sp. NAK00032]QKW33570.1 M4 family metallopeptidase [Actinomadura sp. NAK00032]
MRSTTPARAHRRTALRRAALSSALVTAAATAALGLQAGTATAAPAQAVPAQAPRPADPGQLPAKVSAKEYKALVGRARAQQDETASQLKLGAKVELKAKTVVKDRDGTTHTHYTRTYDGLPVLGGDLIVHRAPSGSIARVTQDATRPLKVDTAPNTLVSTRPATPKAKGSVAPRKVVWMADGEPVLAWETVVGGTQRDGTPNRLHVITDALTGKKIVEWQGVQTGTGNSQYSGTVQLGTTSSGGSYVLRDTGRGNHDTTNLNGATSGRGTLFTDSDDVWGTGSPSSPQTAAVDAAYGAGETWDFYKNVFGRSGIRGDGVGAYSRVHYSSGYVNAFWDDSCFCMTYGDGQGNSRPLTELDVAGHEMTHGVTSNTAGLIYQGESGGLNEATSDIMATAMEFWSNNASDVGDYLIGEKLNIRGDGAPLRYMDRPSKDGSSLDNWSPNAGNVDVHYSSGIANHFFYLLSEGSGSKVINGVQYNSPTADGQPVTGIGREKAAAIWYKALTEEMRPTTNYADARRATLAAASGLYGATSAEYAATANAWAGVNVGGRVDDPGDPGPGDPGDPSGTWAVGTAYNVGDVVTYDGASYRCLQAHTALPGWTPPNVPALWEQV